MEALEKNLLRIKKDMADAAAYFSHPVKLIAVTKRHEASEINPLKELGILDIGENRVQELLHKLPEINEKFHIHLIGQLQSNKVKYIIDKVCQIQSVDRMSLAEEISRQACLKNKVMDVLVEVSPAGEKQKGGVPFGGTRDFVKAIASLPGLQVNGLMAVMPNTDDEKYLDGLFKNMRELFEQLREENLNGVFMKELSMGMSNDYRLALLNGATTIRVGTALFGTGR
jgi:pyridoxal phosphate enzyme, YggS family